ncbi:LOW QUALITY PROTEIN: tubulin epsilon and delta complex protein 1-like [Argopecten irradians]|uniref:LOW QUALITY PROTEIN: tubulin epsilon and delta complex protein 1-like n=1 Tax=Argopecten irradians TaxID=31199 RepID=UPI00371412D2
MSQVRETIELLTKLLRRNGTSKIKAEVFRLAKFNSDEATVPFWRLLFELLYFMKYGVIDDVTIKAYSELTQEELAVYVKKSMQSRGFYSKEFSLLPNDMSSGSRELLLAFAWLMCKENVIVKFMEQCSSPVDENTLSVYEVRECTQGVVLNPKPVKISLPLESPHASKHPDLLIRMVSYISWRERTTSERELDKLPLVMDLSQEEGFLEIGGLITVAFFWPSKTWPSSLNEAFTSELNAKKKHNNRTGIRQLINFHQYGDFVTKSKNLALDNTEQVLKTYKDPELFYQRNYNQ